MSTAHLSCPAQGIRIGLGEPFRGPDGTVTGFTGRPGTDFTRALWKFITDCTTGDLTISLDNNTNNPAYRKIGEPPDAGGIPFGDYLDATDWDHITYYALLLGGESTREKPSGLVRRRHREVLHVDESYTRNDRWTPTQYLVRYNLGHDDIDHVEISEDEATAFVLYRLAKRL